MVFGFGWLDHRENWSQGQISCILRVQEYVLACVLLNDTKPLMDSVNISISPENKIKVYVYYEKLWRFATKVSHDVYGKWRTQEQEIPMEAREEQENKSHNTYIQSFRDFFQKINRFFEPISIFSIGI